MPDADPTPAHARPMTLFAILSAEGACAPHNRDISDMVARYFTLSDGDHIDEGTTPEHL